MLIDPISHISTNFNDYKQAEASIKRLKNINQEPVEDDKENFRRISNFGGKISFKKVNFAYKKDTQVLKNIDLEIKKGEVTAFVGASGAGKSTMMALILKFITPNNGDIFIDDKNLKLLNTFNLQSTELESYISRSENKIVKLYNQKKNIFFNIDLRNKKKINIPSITHYFILFADLKNKVLNNQIIKNLKKHSSKEKYLLSSVKSNHQKFEEKRYWRGPVWINCNWIIYQGLKNKNIKFAKQIKRKTINLVKQKGFNEYFSCKTGKGFGATNFSWTAALFLDLILENKND